ncbi:MAG: transporter [Rubritepida sp.]|nr:transporter [Rubritepida sp.]
MITRRIFTTGLAAGGASAALAARPASAQAWKPTGPIRLVVPYSQGGSTGGLAALIQPAMQAALGQPVELAWIPGNSGIIGASAVLEAPADGQTLLLGSSSLFTAHTFLFGNRLPYVPRTAFAPISRVGTTSVLVAVAASRPWQTIEDVVAAIRAQPGQLKAATSGVGSIGHMLIAQITEGLGLAGAVELVHYDEGGSLQAAALVAGDVDIAIAAAPGLLPLLRAGTVRALATTGKYRAVWTPELFLVPSIDEAYPDMAMDVSDWWGLVARAGTPEPVLAAVNDALGVALEVPAVRAAMSEQGILPYPDPAPDDFGAFWDEDLPVRQRLVEVSGARLE